VKTRTPKTLCLHNRIFGGDLDSADLFLLLNEIVDQNDGSRCPKVAWASLSTDR